MTSYMGRIKNNYNNINVFPFLTVSDYVYFLNFKELITIQVLLTRFTCIEENKINRISTEFFFKIVVMN